MKKLLIIAVILCSFISYSQDLYIQYWDTDQRDTFIKSVWITDENGTIKENNFPAKSHIHLIKIFKERGFKVKDIQVSTYPQASLNKYHIWLDKIDLEKLD